MFRTIPKTPLHSSHIVPAFFFTLLVTAVFTAPAPLRAADLKEETVRAYDRYVQAAEARRAREQHLPDRFLHMDSLPETDRRRVWSDLKRGDLVLDSLQEQDESGRVIRAPHGLITHYIGAMFVPDVTIGQVLDVVQDYDHYRDIYKPEIVRSRLVDRRNGNFKIYLRVHKDTPWVNPTLDISSDSEFSILDSRHATSGSHSTRIVQIENAGQPHEHEDSVGHDGGYLWRLDSCWRFAKRDGGVVAEWEAITLSRDIPFLLRWIVRPFVERLARATLRDTLEATRKQVRQRAVAAHPNN